MKAIELGCALGLLVVISVVGSHVQPPLTLHHGRGWDGQAYFAMAGQLAEGRRPAGEAPFVYRLGTPVLVATLFPDQLQRGFTLVNLAGTAVATVLLVYWLRRHVPDWRVRGILVSLFLLTWHAPARFLQYYPVYGDPWLFVALLAGLLAMERADESPTAGRFVAAALVVAVGAVFREAALLIPAAWFAARPSRAVAAVLASGVVVFVGLRLVVEAHGDYSFVRAAASSAYGKALAGYVHAWCIAYGPLIIVPIVFWRDTWRLFRNDRRALAFLCGVALLAWVGGSDTERIAYWGMPIVYAIVGKVVAAHPSLLRPSIGLALFGVAQLVSARVFWTLPDVPHPARTPWPWLTVPASEFQYLDLYTVHGDRTIQVVSFAGYLLVAVVAGWWMRRRG